MTARQRDLVESSELGQLMFFTVYFLLIIYFCDLKMAQSGRNMS